MRENRRKPIPVCLCGVVAQISRLRWSLSISPLLRSIPYYITIKSTIKLVQKKKKINNKIKKIRVNQFLTQRGAPLKTPNPTFVLFFVTRASAFASSPDPVPVPVPALPSPSAPPFRRSFIRQLVQVFSLSSFYCNLCIVLFLHSISLALDQYEPVPAYLMIKNSLRFIDQFSKISAVGCRCLEFRRFYMNYGLGDNRFVLLYFIILLKIFMAVSFVNVLEELANSYVFLQLFHMLCV